MLPRNAKLYIALVIASGLAVLLLAARSWSPANLKQFAIFLGLAALASTLKLRIPGVESTVTPNFLFLLLSVSVCQFGEVLAISAVMAVVQCVWRSAKQPRLVQVAFNAAALVLSAAAAYKLPHLLLAGKGWDSSIAAVILAACIYFPLNSALVAVVIGLVSGESLRQIGGRAAVWVLPYFLGGIAVAAMVTSTCGPASLWKGALVLIPVMILAHVYFLNRSAHKLTPKPSA